VILRRFGYLAVLLFFSILRQNYLIGLYFYLRCVIGNHYSLVL